MEKVSCKSMPMEYLKDRLLSKGFVSTAKSKKKLCRDMSTLKRIKKGTKIDACMCLDKPEIQAYGKQFGVTLKGTKKAMCNDYYNLDRTLHKVRKVSADPKRAPSLSGMLTNIEKAIVMLQERSEPLSKIRWFLRKNLIPVGGQKADLIIHKLITLRKIINKAKEDKFKYRDLFSDAGKIVTSSYIDAQKFIYGQSGNAGTLTGIKKMTLSTEPSGD